jgi:hypothetical protein
VNIKVEVKGGSKLARELERVGGPDARLVMAHRLREMAIMLHAEAKRGIREQSPGETVTRYTDINGRPRRRVHVVSRPGDTPNTDLGHLINSVEWEPKTTEAIAREQMVRVGSNLDYAAWLEHGTRRMAARPWLAPAWRKLRGTFRSMLRGTRIVGKK